MKTPKQLQTLEFAKTYYTEQVERLDAMAATLKRIMIDGHAPLLGKDGPGNTHGDNLEIRAYAKLIADQMRAVLYSDMMSAEALTIWRQHLHETYFKDLEIVAWRDLLSGIA